MGGKGSGRRRRPATTLEGRENQLISLATDLAETQLRKGTASSQVITHFLKLGSTRERLEQKRIEQENLLTSAKIDAMSSVQNQENMMREAIDAFRRYSGQEVERFDDDD